MKEEIKEILDFLKDKRNYYKTLQQDKTDKLLDYITNLQEENKILKELNVCVGCNNPDYKQRNEKAIEYINHYLEDINNLDNVLVNSIILKEILIILKGDKDEYKI